MTGIVHPRRHRLRHRGVALDAWVAGEGPPVVLIHGWGLSGRPYRAPMRSLSARGFRVVAPSVAVLDPPWTLESAAAAVAESLAALDVDRAPVVGHSFGGVVAVRLAADHPELVEAIVAVNSPLVALRPRDALRILLPGRHYRVAGHAATAAALVGAATRRGGVASLAGAARQILRGDLRAHLEQVRDCAVPAAVLWSEGDTLLPPSLAQEAARSLGCRVEIVRGGKDWPDRRPPDHDWPIRAPGHFAEIIDATLAALLPAHGDAAPSPH